MRFALPLMLTIMASPALASMSCGEAKQSYLGSLPEKGAEGILDGKGPPWTEALEAPGRWNLVAALHIGQSMAVESAITKGEALAITAEGQARFAASEVLIDCWAAEPDAKDMSDRFFAIYTPQKRAELAAYVAQMAPEAGQ